MLHLPFKRCERQCNSLGQWDLYPKPRDFISPFEVLSWEISLFTILMPEQDQLCAGPGVWKSRSYAFLENQQVNFFLCICYSFLFSWILNGKPAFCSHLIAALLLSKYLLLRSVWGWDPEGRKANTICFMTYKLRRQLGVMVGMCWTCWGWQQVCVWVDGLCPLLGFLPSGSNTAFLYQWTIT